MRDYGCYNRDPLKKVVKVQYGWRDNGAFSRKPVMMTVPFRNTTECQYSITTKDPRCLGCKWLNRGDVSVAP